MMIKIGSISKKNFIVPAFVLMLVSGIVAPAATASILGIDGIKTASDDYESGESFVTSWYNDHHSLKFRVEDARTATIWYKKFDDYLQMFVEVPLEAKNMIWGTGVTDAEALLYYQAWCSPLGGGSASLDGSGCDHHNNGFDTFKSKVQSTVPNSDGESKSYKTMTGSEKIVMLDGAGVFDLKDYDDLTDLTGYNDGDFPLVQTSLDYLLKNGCDKISCNASTTTMSFEILFLSAVGMDVVAALKNATAAAPQLIFHLSPERGGPPSVVPVPAAFWLFGTALVGFIGLSRRTSVV